MQPDTTSQAVVMPFWYIWWIYGPKRDGTYEKYKRFDIGIGLKDHVDMENHRIAYTKEETTNNKPDN